MPDNELVVLDEDHQLPAETPPSGQQNLLQLALVNKADIATIEKLVEMQNVHEEKEARKEFFKALSLFQSEIPSIGKKGLADFSTKAGRTTYSFAKQEDIANAIKPLLLKYNLSYRFTQAQLDGNISITCVVTHSAGHSEETTMSAGADTSGGKNSIQQIGSTITYLRRYTMTGALGITVSEEDDDGGLKETDDEYLNRIENKIMACSTEDDLLAFNSRCNRDQRQKFKGMLSARKNAIREGSK